MPYFSKVSPSTGYFKKNAVGKLLGGQKDSVEHHPVDTHLVEHKESKKVSAYERSKH